MFIPKHQTIELPPQQMFQRLITNLRKSAKLNKFFLIQAQHLDIIVIENELYKRLEGTAPQSLVIKL